MTPDRFIELCELAADGSLSPAEDAELGAHLARDPAARESLRLAIRHHLQCRAALLSGERARTADRVDRLLQARRPSRRQRAARTVLERLGRRQTRRRRLLRWGLPALAALIACALLPLLGRGGPPPTDPSAPRMLAGDARLDGSPIRPGQELRRGLALETAAGWCEVAWPDGSVARLGAGTRVVRPDADGQRLALEHGSLAVQAAHRPADDPLRITCPDAEAVILGTRLDLSVADGHSVLHVRDGLVRWTRLSDGAASVVGAGQRLAAAELPAPRSVLLDAARIAAVRRAIAAGRPPWSTAWTALRAAPPSVVRDAWHRPLAVALAARLEPDDALGGTLAVEAIRHLRTSLLTQPAGSETAAAIVSVVLTTDLLQLSPAWQGADGRAVGAWIEELLPGCLRASRASTTAGERWWGFTAALAAAARSGDERRMPALFADLRRDLAVDLAPARRGSLRPGDLVPVLLAADILRSATGRCPPPPPTWLEVLAAWPDPQDLVALPLRGPPPWRLPDARAYADARGGWPEAVLTGLDPRFP